MNPAIVIALVDGYKATVELWSKIVDAMPEEKREHYAAMIAEREIWWQENVWRKLGELLDGDS